MQTFLFQTSDYNIWNILVQFGLVCVMLLLGNIARRKVKFLKNMLFPTAIIAGFIGLGLKYLLEWASFNISGIDFSASFQNFLEAVTYHTLALGFIAMGLKTVKKDKKSFEGKPIKTGMLIVNTYLIQGIVGVLLTAGLFMIFKQIPQVGGKLTPYSGLLLPMGYGQGPGQAGNIGQIFQDAGFDGGKSFGLAVAMFGFLWACGGGIFYLNRRAKEGKVSRAAEETASDVKSTYVETKEEIPVSEAIDKLSIQIIFVVIVYLISFFFMKGITYLIDVDSINSIIWGFNFIFAMLFAILFKVILNALTKKKIVKRKYTNEYMLDRITGVVFDFMVVTSIMAIDLKVIFENVDLLIGLLVISTVGGFLTYFYLKFIIKKIYPTYEHESFAALFGMLTGTASNGIALLREIDPEFKTPAADNLLTGSSSAVMFGAPILVITMLIHKPEWYYLWGSVVVMCIIFAVYSYFLVKKPKVLNQPIDVENTNNKE